MNQLDLIGSHPLPDRVAGVDEAGRGPLAGPVYAACVVLDPTRPIEGLADSKVLNEARRERLFEEIQARSLDWHIACVDASVVDRRNILQATMEAMALAVSGLASPPALALIDGNRCPALSCPARGIVRGDALVPAISAASILAKVSRDRAMVEYDARYPGYGFAAHKGYGTRKHIEALNRLGPSPIHRMTFAPVRKVSQEASA